MKPILRSYQELITLPTFLERYRYLKIEGNVGEETFGYDRYLNQRFYQSREWHQIRDLVIVRDFGFDLGVLGYDIQGQILVHHMNPIRPKDFRGNYQVMLDPDVLISTSKNTHLAIHYGSEELLPKIFEPRQSGDTRLW